MKFLNKIFKKKTVLKEDPGFPPRAARVDVKIFHQIKLIIDDKEYEPLNISSTGVAFYTDQSTFSKAQNLNCKLHIADKVAEAQLEVVHTQDNFTGCRVISGETAFKNYIQYFLETEIAAIDINYIPPEKLNDDPDGTPHWYQKNEQFKLYFTETSQKINKFEITYLGHYFSMNTKGATTFGVEWHDKSAESVSQIDQLSPEIHQGIERFITSMDKLPKNFKEQILSKL